MAQYDREAEAVLNTFAEIFIERDWKFEREDEESYIYLGVAGEDLPMHIFIRANPNRGMLQIFSKMPVKISSEKIMEAAMIVNEFNDRRMLGNFDLDISSGDIIFRVCTCIAGCNVSMGACDVLFNYAIKIIDEYNDKFLLFNKGVLSLEEILNGMDD